MATEPPSDPQRPEAPEPGNAIFWLLLGLAPIPILLVTMQYPSRALGPVVVTGCAACNLIGALGCLRGIRELGARVFLALLLGGAFFVLSWIVVLYQACSHMNL